MFGRLSLNIWAYGKFAQKMVPGLLNDDQKEPCMQIRQDLIKHLQTEPNLLCRVITGDETWIFDYDVETKHQSNHWKSLITPRLKKTRQLVMLIMFFDVKGIVQIEFLSQDQTID